MRRQPSDLWASNAVCEADARPKVAFCFAGAARTLVQPRIYRSVRSNLIEAFGGDAVIFAAIKLPDHIGDRTSRIATSDQRTRVELALSHIGAKGRRVILTNESRLPGSQEPQSCAKQPRPSERALFDSMVAQLNNRAACHSLIVGWEVRHQSQFQFVIYARPDMVWPVAMRPYCFWDRSKLLRKRDYVYMLPRIEATKLLQEVPSDFFLCRHQWKGELPETYRLPSETDDRQNVITAKLWSQKVLYKGRWVAIGHDIVHGDYMGVRRNPKTGSYRAVIPDVHTGKEIDAGTFSSAAVAAAERGLLLLQLEKAQSGNSD